MLKHGRLVEAISKINPVSYPSSWAAPNPVPSKYETAVQAILERVVSAKTGEGV